MVVSTAYGESRPLYGGLYTIGGYGERYFYQIWVAAFSQDWPSYVLGVIQTLDVS